MHTAQTIFARTAFYMIARLVAIMLLNGERPGQSRIHFSFHSPHVRSLFTLNVLENLVTNYPDLQPLGSKLDLQWNLS